MMYQSKVNPIKIKITTDFYIYLIETNVLIEY